MIYILLYILYDNKKWKIDNDFQKKGILAQMHIKKLLKNYTLLDNSNYLFKVSDKQFISKKLFLSIHFNISFYSK